MKESKKDTQNKEQIKIKNETQNNFIIVYDSIYKNTKLSANELGLLIKLLSLAPTFKPTKLKMMALLHISEHTLLKAIKGLKEKGYLKIKKYGLKSEWIITQEPYKTFENISKESILKALIHSEMKITDVKQLHKLKYINDNELIEITNEFIKEIKRIANTKYIDD